MEMQCLPSLQSVSSTHAPFQAGPLKTIKGHLILLCRSEYVHNPDISRARLNQNHMTAMEKYQPPISVFPVGVDKNLHEKLPYLRLWKELKANQG